MNCVVREGFTCCCYIAVDLVDNFASRMFMILLETEADLVAYVSL